MENGVNRLEVGRAENLTCYCPACEGDRTMSRKTMKTAITLIVVIVIAAIVYKKWPWIKSQIANATGA